jgi:hypothetical protein
MSNKWYAKIEKQLWVKDDGTEQEHDTVVETIWTVSKESPWVETTQSEIGKMYKDENFYEDTSWKLSEYQQDTAEKRARAWRDEELQNTDWIISVSDHPQLAAYKTYRTKLRDWPSTSDFPATRPELG